MFVEVPAVSLICCNVPLFFFFRFFSCDFLLTIILSTCMIRNIFTAIQDPAVKPITLKVETIPAWFQPASFQQVEEKNSPNFTAHPIAPPPKRNSLSIIVY